MGRRGKRKRMAMAKTRSALVAVPPGAALLGTRVKIEIETETEIEIGTEIEREEIEIETGTGTADDVGAEIDHGIGRETEVAEVGAGDPDCCDCLCNSPFQKRGI